MEVFYQRPDSTYVVPPEPVTLMSESQSQSDDYDQEEETETETETDHQSHASDNTSQYDDH